MNRAWTLGRIGFTALTLRDLEEMSEPGLALLDEWLGPAIDEYNRANGGKG